MRKFAAIVGLVVLAVVPGTGSLTASDWSRFRGPNGSGVSADSAAPPVEWSETKNLKWKIDLPGPGTSSPIVVGDRIFVTCWTGYGVERERPGDQKDLKRNLLCLDRATGKQLWSRAVPATLPEEEYRGMFAEHGYASHTPTSDGERVYVFFGKSGVLAFDLAGKQLWQTNVGNGDDPKSWGSAASPILYEKLLIVPATVESQSLVALDKLTGKEVWRKQADGFGSTWGTPILVESPGGKTELVIGVPYEIWSFDPATGKLLWFCQTFDENSMCSSLVAHDGIVYGVEGRSGGSIAVRAGGQGDVTKTHVLWSGRDRGRITTPIYQNGRLYWINGGILNCVDASDDKRVYQKRLSASGGGAGGEDVEDAPPGRPGPGGQAGEGRGGRRGGPGGPDADQAAAPREGNPPDDGPPGNRPPGGERGRGGQRGGPGRGGMGRGGPGGRGGQDYASPVAAGGKLYFVSRSGNAYVAALEPEFKLLATNHFESDHSGFTATPAISNGQLFIRSDKHLYCVSQ